MLEIYSVILRLVAELRPCVRRIEKCDADLGRQMRRAMSSVVLNVAEGMGSRGGNQAARYHSALGSMYETRACVDVGIALGYVEGVEPDVADRIARVVGTLVRLARR